MRLPHHRKQSDSPPILLSPLIDCVFLLLIFFLVATMFKKDNKDVALVPPESSSAQKMLADDKSMVVGVDAAGEFYIEGVPSSIGDLHHRLREISLEDNDRQIRLDADASVPFASVAEVLNLCQFFHLTNVGIRTYDDRYNRK